MSGTDERGTEPIFKVVLNLVSTSTSEYHIIYRYGMWLLCLKYPIVTWAQPNLFCNHFRIFHLCLISVVDFSWMRNIVRKNLRTANTKPNISIKIKPSWNVWKTFLRVVLLLGYMIIIHCVMFIPFMAHPIYTMMRVPLPQTGRGLIFAALSKPVLQHMICISRYSTYSLVHEYQKVA